MSLETPTEGDLAREELQASYEFAKGFRAVAEFVLQLLTRAALWATISAAAKVTNDRVIIAFENVTLIAIFAWCVWSFQTAKAFLELKLHARPQQKRRLINAIVIGEMVLIIVCWMGASTFATALAARFAQDGASSQVPALSPSTPSH